MEAGAEKTTEAAIEGGLRGASEPGGRLRGAFGCGTMATVLPRTRTADSGDFSVDRRSGTERNRQVVRARDDRSTNEVCRGTAKI